MAHPPRSPDAPRLIKLDASHNSIPARQETSCPDDLREATAIQLSQIGFSVHVAASTHEALSLIDADSDFDILLTDFRLSETSNGAQLAREVESRVPGISVIVMSGYLSIEDADSLDPKWVLIEKPVAKAELLRALKRAGSLTGRTEARSSLQ